MRIKDEATFMQKSGGVSPVMDGLICWIDCSNFNVDDLLAYDSVNSEYVEVAIPYGGVTYEMEENCLRINPNGNRQMHINKKYDGVYTIELIAGSDYDEECIGAVADFGTSYPRVVVGQIRNYRVDRKVTASNGSESISVDFSEDKLHHIVFSVGSDKIGTLYVDGVNCGTLSNFKTTSFYPMMSGNWTNTDSKTSTYWSCTRFYNRALSEEEILQNYNYEKSLGRVE